MDLPSIIITSSIILGQLIKLPLFGQGGITAADISISILCLYGVLKLKAKFKKPPIFILVGFVFCGISVISLLITPLKLSMQETLISFFYIVRFFLYILFGLLIFSGSFRQLRKNIPKILLFSGIAVSALGVTQFIFLKDLSFLTASNFDGHFGRLVSTFLDPSFIGGYFILTLLLLVQNPLKLSSKTQIVLFSLLYLSLLTTYSRGSYLMFAVSFAALSFLNKSVKLAILTALLCLGLFIGFNDYTKEVAAPRNIDRVQSAQFRVNSWQLGLQIFNNSPIFGVGYNSYRYALKEYKLVPESYLLSRGSSSNDSSLLHAFATTGIVGGVIYLLFLGYFFYYGRNLYLLKSRNGVVLISGLSGLIIHSFFANSLFYPFILIWLILIAVE